MKLDTTQQEFINYLNDNSNTNARILFQGGTGCGKTTLISYLPKFVKYYKVIFISLSPSLVVSSRIKLNQKGLGFNPIGFNEFRNIRPQDNLISIVDTHASINSESSKIHSDGDIKGVLTLLNEYHKLGYKIILSVDESGVFVTDENNETVKMIEKLPTNIIELHFSATPDLSIHYDKIFTMGDEEIKKTKRVKSRIDLFKLGHSDDYEMINDVLDKLEEIIPYYNGHTVSVQFVCEAGKDKYVSVKKMITDICSSRGIKESEIFDLTVEGKSDNVDKYEKFIDEISKNTKHKYKVILTKYAGTIGFDCPSISVLGLMRNIPTSSEKQKIQIIGRAKRIFDGLKAQNIIQDTVYLYVKDDFIIPSYMQNEINNHQNVTYSLVNSEIISQVEIISPKVRQVEDKKNFQTIDDLINNMAINYGNVKTQLNTTTTVYHLNNTDLISGDTIINSISDTEVNHSNKLTIPQSLDLVSKLKMGFNILFNGSFEYILSKFDISEKELVIDFRYNVNVRELFNKIYYKFKKTSKRYEVYGEKKYEFPIELIRHQTVLEKEIDENSVHYDKILYSDINNKIYFDSKPEIIFFDEIVSRRYTKWIYQNPRTNQGGLSFYIPEYDINHSPDYVINYRGNMWIIEVTSWNKISEKEKYIKSQGVPTNYMLVALDNQNNLLSLTKEEYNEDNYLKSECWTKLNQRYDSL